MLPDHSAAFEAHLGAKEGGRFRFSLPLLRHIAAQPRFARATLGRAGHARIQRRVRSILVQIVLPELSAGGGGAEAALEREARAHAVVGAFLGLVAWWLDGHERVRAEVVDRAFQEVVASAWPPLSGPATAGGSATARG